MAEDCSRLAGCDDGVTRQEDVERNDGSSVYREMDSYLAETSVQTRVIRSGSIISGRDRADGSYQEPHFSPLSAYP